MKRIQGTSKLIGAAKSKHRNHLNIDDPRNVLNCTEQFRRSLRKVVPRATAWLWSQTRKIYHEKLEIRTL